MIAKNFISNTLGPLRNNDTGETALSIMQVYHVKHLPLIHQGKLVGILGEDQILNFDLNQYVETYAVSLLRAYAYETDHLFDLMQRFAYHRITTLPVIDKEENYKGMIALEDLMFHFADSFSFREKGSILVLSTTIQHYSMAEIARIIESESAQILCSFVTMVPESNSIMVTLKISNAPLQRLVASFQRFEYEVSGSFSEEEYTDVLQERYNSLMHYLNI